MSLMLTHFGPPPVNVFSPGSIASISTSFDPAASLAHPTRKLWQDAGKTTPAVADGDPIRVATCPYTGNDLTAPSDGQRPILHTDGAGHWWATFDGVDDILVAGVRIAGPPFTLTFSGKPSSLAGNPVAWGAENSEFAQYRVSSSGKQLLFAANDGTGIVNGTAAVSANQNHAWLTTYSGTAVAYWLDGSTDGGGAFNVIAANMGPKAVGRWIPDAGQIWIGNICAALSFTAVLQAADVAAVNAYMIGRHP